MRRRTERRSRGGCFFCHSAHEYRPNRRPSEGNLGCAPRDFANSWPGWLRFSRRVEEKSGVSNPRVDIPRARVDGATRAFGDEPGTTRPTSRGVKRSRVAARVTIEAFGGASRRTSRVVRFPHAWKGHALGNTSRALRSEALAGTRSRARAGRAHGRQQSLLRVWRSRCPVASRGARRYGVSQSVRDGGVL